MPFGERLPKTRAALVLPLLFAITGQAQELPEDVGRAETIKLCSQCHEMARSISLRQDKPGWNTTMSKMIAFGMKGSEKQFALVVDYLTKHFPAEEVPRLNVNTATAIELESALSLKRSQAAALIAYREKNGPFKNLDELKKAPAVDPQKIEAKKDRIVF